MIPGRIFGAHRTLSAPTDWDKNEHGPCVSLSIRNETDRHGLPVMVSAWFPTPEEIAAIVAGAPVYLRVMGKSHPPVMVIVENVP